MRFLRWLGTASLILSLAASYAAAAVKPGAKLNRRAPHRAASNIDNTAHMDANNLDMVVTNHGSFAYDLLTGNSGLIYPKGSTKTAVFAAGPWLGAKVGSEVRVAVGEYSQEFVPGPMVGGTFQPDNGRFRSYKIVRGNTTSADYLNWPVDQGAPLDSTGAPALLGDAMIWSVYNDADPGAHSNQAGSTNPLGVEVQQSTFAYNRSGALGNIIFVRFKLINKGGNQLDSMFVSAWSDPDLGGATDDLVGCDTTRSLGYVYNATNTDQLYGGTTPAVGFDFFRGPIVPSGTPGVFDTLGMASFNKYINGTDPKSSGETYNFMKGLNADGTPIINPVTSQITRFQVSGDPVANTGWLDTSPADRRLQLSTGPFSMAPGDSQEITIAIIVGQGTDRLSSITDLKNKDDQAQIVFDLNFDIPAPPPAPTVYAQELDRKIRLIWDQAAVGTHSANAILGQDFVFEGFRVWQLPSQGGFSDARVIATYDEVNGFASLYSDLFNPAVGGIERLKVVSGPDEGLRFQIDITQDAFRGGRLVNNKPYYFAVTAYALDTLNVTPYIIGVNQVGTITEVLESALNVVRATPRGSNAVFGVTGQQVAGDFVGGTISAAQVNTAVIGDTLYNVTRLPSGDWAVINTVTGDTLTVGPSSPDGGFTSPVIDGFIATVTRSPNAPSLIHQLMGGPGLTGATDSLNFSAGGGPDSSGTVYFSNYITVDIGDPWDINNFNFDDTSQHDYVLVMLPDTTQFAWNYAGGAPSAPSTFKVPWEVFDLGECSYTDPSDDVKMSIMVRDRDGDGTYSFGDAIYIRQIPYAAVAWGTPGIMSTDYAGGSEEQPFGRFTLYTPAQGGGAIPYPLPGGRFRVRGGSLCPGDAFAFRTVPAGAAPGTIVGSDIKKVLAVPNPYYAHSQYELTQFDRVIKFTNIPASRNVTIRIFNLGGDLIRTIRRSASAGDDMSRAEIVWDLNTENRLPVGSGIYIYRVEAEGVGSKTDRIAVFVEKERLDNF
jgi:hypothetical protein